MTKNIVDTDREKLRVGVYTPYLLPSRISGLDREEVEIEKRNGLDPEGAESLGRALDDRVLLYDMGETQEVPVALALVGSTPRGEEEAESLKGTGIIVARYSKFHGGVSRYSGKTAAKGGYALDIPKDIATLRAVLSDEQVVRALIDRDEKRIWSALESLNGGLDRPILVTPYLPEALRAYRSDLYIQRLAECLEGA